MAIKNQRIGTHTEFIAECDICQKKFNTQVGNFKEATSVMKRNGWFLKKYGEKDWKHVCGRECFSKLDNRRVI